MIKGSIYPGNILFLNVYISNNKVQKYMKQKLIELKDKKLNKSTI
jgi:hypothetical protein